MPLAEGWVLEPKMRRGLHVAVRLAPQSQSRLQACWEPAAPEEALRKLGQAVVLSATEIHTGSAAMATPCSCYSAEIEDAAWT